MKFRHSPKFKASFRKFPVEIRKKFYKQANFLLGDIRHPSLRAKKYDEARGIWQARIDRNAHFYFLIEGDVYILLDVKYHPK